MFWASEPTPLRFEPQNQSVAPQADPTGSAILVRFLSFPYAIFIARRVQITNARYEHTNGKHARLLVSEKLGLRCVVAFARTNLRLIGNALDFNTDGAELSIARLILGIVAQ